MREILFRGKSLEGKWVYGSHRLFKNGCGDKHFIIDFEELDNGGIEYEVDPKTISQYTEFKDRDNNKIYNNDILMDEQGWCGVVKYDLCGGYYVDYEDDAFSFDAEKNNWCKIVGNIHDDDIVELESGQC